MFVIDQRVSDLEFRIETFGDFDGRLLRYTLSPVDPQEMAAMTPGSLREDEASADAMAIPKASKLRLRKLLGLVADGTAFTRR